MDYGNEEEKPSTIDHRRKFSFLNAECAWDAYDADDASLTTCTTLSDNSLYELGRISESMIDIELSMRLSNATAKQNNRKSSSGYHHRRTTKHKLDRRRSSSSTTACAAAASATATIEACNNAVQDFVQARATTVTNNMNFLGRVRHNLGEIGIADNNQSNAKQEYKQEESQPPEQQQSFWQARMGTLTKNLETLSWAFQG